MLKEDFGNLVLWAFMMGFWRHCTLLCTEKKHTVVSVSHGAAIPETHRRRLAKGQMYDSNRYLPLCSHRAYYAMHTQRLQGVRCPQSVVNAFPLPWESKQRYRQPRPHNLDNAAGGLG